MSAIEKYRAVIGLEVHVQLNTDSKLFSGEPTTFGAAPNTQVGPYSAGHPGTLPVLNEKAVDYAVMMGFALNCEVNRYSEFARKNYFYPDLPKGYQISQFSKPVCGPGSLVITVGGEQKRIGITRIHLEEDAGKSIHDLDERNSMIDLNRAGVPLIEIVSEPELSNGREASEYVSEIRKIVRHLGICDGNMEEGSLRCDANVSVMLKDADSLGEKVEIKNMNSLRNVRRAVEYEIQRQIKLAEAGEEIVQETRSYDADKNLTFSMREKEMAHDYRYFPDPDLPPVLRSKAQLAKLRSQMPVLPQQLVNDYQVRFGLSEYDANVIASDRALSDYYNELAACTTNYKAAANWLLGPVKSHLNDTETQLSDMPVQPQQLADLIGLIDANKINFSIASQQVFPLMIEREGVEVEELVAELNVVQESSVEVIQQLVDEAIAKFPDKVKAYRSGRKGILGLFMGEVMKASNGKADPKITNKLLLDKLNEST